jgi:hypothetical protein
MGQQVGKLKAEMRRDEGAAKQDFLPQLIIWNGLISNRSPK